MWAILRILFGFALFVVFGKAVEVAGPAPTTEGTTDAGYLAVLVMLGIANAVVWAPWVGRWVADPLTGAFTAGHPADFSNRPLQLAHKLALRRWRRSALFFAFLEGVRNPDLPGAFVLGMTHSRPGSLLEKIFAKEVWRFENAENCLRAWNILRRHGIEPDLHHKAEVNLLLLSQRREVPPTPEALAVPPAPPPPKPARNPAIRVFRPQPDPTTANLDGMRTEPTPLAGEPTEALGEPGLVDAAATSPAEAVGGPSCAPEPASLPSPRPTGKRLGFGDRLKVLFTGRLEG